MRVSRITACSQTPSMGLEQDCLLSTTLFGLYIDGFCCYLKTAAPAAAVQTLRMGLKELRMSVSLLLSCRAVAGPHCCPGF